MNKLHDAGDLLGRILISLIFIMAGYSKIGGYAGTQAYMESMGVPGALLPLVILVEPNKGEMSERIPSDRINPPNR